MSKLPLALEFCRVLSIVAFFWYGFQCLFLERMAREFERFGLEPFRRTVGALEMIGAVGLVLSYKEPALGIAAAMGLGVLMFAGSVVRMRIQDTLVQSLPAMIFMLINFYLGYGIMRQS
ncbi:MAG: hypothetical protein ACI97A_000314 [Planctomycetota bacterium]|jgi:hypothetical protein